MEKYINLRKNQRFVKNQKWTLENIKDGLEYFRELKGRYPSSDEINTFEFLPNRKLIERNFGGVVNLRKTLNLDGSVDFTKGKTRSDMARKAFLRAQEYEERFFNFLIKRIPEVRVHEHKIIRPGNTASDFFIYTSDKEGIMIDVFYAQSLRTLAGIIRIKSQKSLDVRCPIYYVLMDNKEIKQEDIEFLIKNKKISLSENIQVMTEEYFKKVVIESMVFKPLSYSI